jgi:hypothetical protein
MFSSVSDSQPDSLTSRAKEQLQPFWRDGSRHALMRVVADDLGQTRRSLGQTLALFLEAAEMTRRWCTGSGDTERYMAVILLTMSSMGE